MIYRFNFQRPSGLPFGGIRNQKIEIMNKDFKQGSGVKSEISPADGKPPVMCCGLTEVEFTERERLIELQRSRTRWFSQQEFDRLKELSEKMFANAGSPHSP